jgi:hypothetical protein
MVVVSIMLESKIFWDWDLHIGRDTLELGFWDPLYTLELLVKIN